MQSVFDTMDFEIEGDDDYDFEDDWKRNKSKTSYFGGGDGGGGGDDTYDFDFGDVSSSKNKSSYNNVRSSYAPTSSSQPASKLKDVNSVSKSMSAIDKSGDDALAKAQNMLNKYAAKPVQKKKPASSMFDFDEDDISVDSEEGASPVRSKGFGQNKSKLSSNQRGGRRNASDSMDSMDMDSDLEDSGSADIGAGLDSGPPMFGDEAPPMPSLKEKSRAPSFSHPDPVAEKESLASIHNDYDDVVPDEPSPYKGPSGSNYGRTAVNNFSIDEEDVVGESYSEEEFDEVEEEEAESRGLSRSRATGGLIGSQHHDNAYSDDDHDNSDFSEKYEESAEELNESKAISEEHNYSMDYADDVEDDDDEEEVVKPKVNLMSFAGSFWSLIILFRV